METSDPLRASTLPIQAAVTVATVSAATAVSALVAGWAFGLAYSPTAVVLDALLLAPLLLALRPAARGPVAVAALALGVAGALLVGNAVKLTLMGSPLVLSDLGLVPHLLGVLDGWRLALGLGVLGLALGLPLVALRWNRRLPLGVGLIALYLAALAMLAAPVDGWLERRDAGGGTGGQAAALSRHGAVVFLLREFARSREELHDAPDRDRVTALLAGVGPVPASPPPTTQRDVYLILLESVWDPLQLAAFEFSEDPFDPRFRRLWEATGRSHALVPVFGGVTANSEFEALCGLPALAHEVVFERPFRHGLPCLPRQFAELGYRTVASHPNEAGYWNRDRAYPRIGFELFQAREAFALDDLDGMFLSDASLFAQLPGLRQRRQREAQRPEFHYVVSIGSHYPYARNRERRPDRIEVRPAAPILRDYANGLRYATAAFMDWLEGVRERDSEALIVAFGDHAPVLDATVRPYRRSGLEENAGGEGLDPAERLAVLAATPLIVIDGARGPLETGRLPLYRLPELILERLGIAPSSMPQVLAMRSWDPARLRMTRSFRGRLLADDGDGWRLCPLDGGPAISPECRADTEWLERLRLLRSDLAWGHQHALAVLGLHSSLPAQAMEQVRLYRDCEIVVSEWGPAFTRRGEGFNVQPNGRSAFWLRLEAARGQPQLRVDGISYPITLGQGLGSVSLPAADFLARPGRYRLEVGCDGEEFAAIGEFEVLP